MQRAALGSFGALVACLLVAGGCAEGSTLTGGEGSGAGTTTNNGAGGEGAGSTDGGGVVGGGPEGGSGAGTEGGGGEGPIDKCGNGTLDAGEDCDGSLLGDATCENIGQGYVGGDLACASDCTFETSGCEASPDCGNGMIDGTEECDTNNINGASCADQGLSTGSVTCGGGCVLDYSACYQCGNGTVEGPEECDGTNLGGQTCVTLGHDGGVPSCSANCLVINESPCTDCGDNQAEGAEVCDGTALNGQTCQTQGFATGNLACNGNCTAFNTAGCSGTSQTCGNNVREGTEVCDGTALNGQTCATQGFIGGNLACNGTCSGYVTTGCTGAQCSDGSDNDLDGYTDATDPGCSSPSDNEEHIFLPNCNGIGGPIYDITHANQTVSYGYTGNTVGIPNAFGPTDFTYDCTQATGGEVVMLFRNNSLKSAIGFELFADFDAVLYVRAASCNAAYPNEVCNDDDFISESYIELVNLPAGDYYVIVDGYGGQAGNFEINILF